MGRYSPDLVPVEFDRDRIQTELLLQGESICPERDFAHALGPPRRRLEVLLGNGEDAEALAGERAPKQAGLGGGGVANQDAAPVSDLLQDVGQRALEGGGDDPCNVAESQGEDRWIIQEHVAAGDQAHLGKSPSIARKARE